ncbi:MAG: sporulation protein YqfD [Clostridiales bacterium]|nr:sporulation protein YqfD [Clostridiales bacterium]
MRKTSTLLQGSVRLEAVGALPAGLLNACARAGVPFWQAEPADACTLRLTVRRRDLHRVRRLAMSAQCTVRVCAERGAPKYARRLHRRWVLLIGLPVCLALWFLSSLFLWDIDIVGNETVPDSTILRALDDNGVCIGSFWPSFTSDMIRCGVLLQLPELRWITVNVHGSRATVIVRERTPVPEIVDERQPADIVAAKAGVVSRLEIFSGAATVETGQTVLPGELLVTGLVPSSFSPPRLVHAAADVQARTWYDSTALTPLTRLEKVPTGEYFTRWAVAFGKQRINFYRNSSISHPGYDKIIKETQLGLRGVFAFPVTVIRERFERYETHESAVEREPVEAALRQRLLQQLSHELDGGTALSVRFSVSAQGDLLAVTLRAECLENIALTVEHAPQRGMNE